ncbi:hypothetical protein [Lacipirellula parvula]|nr:hypothetical protein [Lacipirellula parvula]
MLVANADLDVQEVAGRLPSNVAVTATGEQHVPTLSPQTSVAAIMQRMVGAMKDISLNTTTGTG